MEKDYSLYEYLFNLNLVFKTDKISQRTELLPNTSFIHFMNVHLKELAGYYKINKTLLFKLKNESLNNITNTEENMYGISDKSYESIYNNLDLYLKPIAFKFQPQPYERAMKSLDQFFSEMPNFQKSSLFDVFESCDLTRSSGVSLNKIFLNKLDVLGTDYGYHLLDVFQNYMAQDKIAITLFGANLKDELRPLEKIVQHKSRLFMSCDALMAITCNTYLLKFNQFMDQYKGSPIGIGINKYSSDWNEMVSSITSCELAHGIDFSKYDKYIPADLMLYVMNKIRDKITGMTDRDHRIYDNIIYNLIHTHIVLPDGQIVQKHRGNPSGFVSTTQINTIIHLFITLYCFYVDNPSLDYETFKKKVVTYLIGDDEISGYPKSLMNPSRYKELIQSHTPYEIELETFDKPKQHLIKFCGHRSTMVNGVYYPVLDFEMLLGHLAYGVRKNANPINILQKIVGMKIEGFFNFKFISILNMYGDYFIKQYDQHYHKIKQRSSLVSIFYDDFSTFLLYYNEQKKSSNNKLSQL